MDHEIDPVWEAEQKYERAQQEVRRLGSEMELARAELTIARIRLERSQEAERSNRGW